MTQTAARYQRVLAGVSEVVSRIPEARWNAPANPVVAVAGDPASAWAATTRRMDSLLAVVDPATTVPSHHGDVAVESVLGTAVIEPLIHAWDLAQAAGLAVSLDEEAVAACPAVIAPMAERFAATGWSESARPLGWPPRRLM
ncbi:hypothetical protein ACWC98_24380 [Streptomyces goshikiensis]